MDAPKHNCVSRNNSFRIVFFANRHVVYKHKGVLITGLVILLGFLLGCSVLSTSKGEPSQQVVEATHSSDILNPTNTLHAPETAQLSPTLPSTKTNTPLPVITTTPVPDDLIWWTITFEFGNRQKRCFSLLPNLAKERADNLFFSAKNVGRGIFTYFSEETFENWPVGMKVENWEPLKYYAGLPIGIEPDISNPPCLTMVQDIPFGVYNILYHVKLFEREGTGNSSQQKLITEEDAFLRIIILPRIDDTAVKNRIAFIRYGESAGSELCVSELDGSKLSCLTSTDSPNPVWSPDGKSLLYTYNEILAVINVDSTDKRRLTEPDKYPGKPSWSPDGKWIALEYIGSQGFGIYKMSADGSDILQIADSATNPVWSPNGKHIVFLKDGDLYRVNPDGSDLLQLTSTEGFEQNPVWSPDSQAIAYVLGDDLYVVMADGEMQIRLTNNMRVLENPTWSPDAAKIAFATTNGIFIINKDGSGSVKLNYPGSELIWTPSNPVWSPDGSMIAFSLGKCPPCIGNSIYVVALNDLSLIGITHDDFYDDSWPTWQPLP